MIKIFSTFRSDKKKKKCYKPPVLRGCTLKDEEKGHEIIINCTHLIHIKFTSTSLWNTLLEYTHKQYNIFLIRFTGV